MEEKANDTILKVARGESVTKEELSSVADLFANTTTNVVVFAPRVRRIKWRKIIAEANIASDLLLTEDDWQQNIDRALDFGDIIIIDDDVQGEEIYNALIANDKSSRKVIVRDYPMPENPEPKGITIYRYMKYFRPRALRYAVKVSVVLRHAVIPFDASTIPVLIVDDVFSNFLLLKTLLKMSGYNKDLIYRAENNLEAVFKMERFSPMIMTTDVLHLGGNGIILMQMLTEKKEFDDAVLCFLTALNQPTEKERCFAAGCDGFTNKPFRKDPILAQINSYALTAQYVKVYNEVMKAATTPTS